MFASSVKLILCHYHLFDFQVGGTNMNMDNNKGKKI